jgi:primosomal protein N' (replication factor Y)
MTFVPTRVQLNRPLPPLTYLAPEGLPAGVRVRVKVRTSLAVGLAMGPDPAPPAAKLRPIEAVLDPFPLLPRSCGNCRPSPPATTAASKPTCCP